MSYTPFTLICWISYVYPATWADSIPCPYNYPLYHPHPASQSPTATLIREIDTLECSTTRGLDAAQAECQTIHQNTWQYRRQSTAEQVEGVLATWGGDPEASRAQTLTRESFQARVLDCVFDRHIRARLWEIYEVTHFVPETWKRETSKEQGTKRRKCTSEETKKRQTPMRKATMTPQALLALSLFGKH